MSTSSLKILCRYQYDPLDRLMAVGLLERASTQRFYQEDHLTTELGEQTQRTIFRHEARPLAQQQSTAGVTETKLLATDQAHSLLQTLTETNPQQLAYTVYGHHPTGSGLNRLIGFNGESPDAITGHYLLGQGKRAFNPVLMRFNSPDELSPFGEGGINSYAYCGGDPINFNDPTGNVRVLNLFKPWNFSKTQIVRPSERTLKALDPTSIAITRSNQQAHNPSLNARLATPASASAPQPRPGTSTSQVSEFTHTLPKTRPHSLRTDTPAIRTEWQRKYNKTGIEYDEYVANNPNFKPKINSKLRHQRKLHEKAVSELKDTTPKQTIYSTRAKLRNTELQIKQYNVINHIRK